MKGGKRKGKRKSKSSARRKSDDATLASCSNNTGDGDAEVCLLKLVLDIPYLTIPNYISTVFRRATDAANDNDSDGMQQFVIFL